MGSIVVLGSLNLDIVVPVPHHPAAGETVLGGDSFRNPGGKGANQAVAAARLGQNVTMIGRVGDDDAGPQLVDALNREGVDTNNVLITPGAPSGIALITVDDKGENAIVVSPGANARVTASDVDDASHLLRDAAVLLLQLEIPIEAVMAAARATDGKVILNSAPAQPLPGELMGAVDVLVANRGEVGVLTGQPSPPGKDEAAALAAEIKGPGAVVVTLGADGALVVEDENRCHVPAIDVQPVDTTAAGDAFCGALVDGLVRGDQLDAAVQWAVRAAALATTRRGAQASLPRREEVERLNG